MKQSSECSQRFNVDSSECKELGGCSQRFLFNGREVKQHSERS